MLQPEQHHVVLSLMNHQSDMGSVSDPLGELPSWLSASRSSAMSCRRRAERSIRNRSMSRSDERSVETCSWRLYTMCLVRSAAFLPFM